MDAGLSAARQVRTHHRHELRTLTYVTLDQANGGIVRNLNHDGIGVQVVAAVRPRQQLRVRFELRYPRLRVETRGEVVWATFSGQCGIRFLDLSPRMARQINEWIFGNLLDGAALHADAEQSVLAKPEFGPRERTFGEKESGETMPGELKFAGWPSTAARRRQETEEPSAVEEEADEEEDDDGGLIVSAAPLKVIELPMRPEDVVSHLGIDSFPGAAADEPVARTRSQLDWLSQPLSSNGLAWTVNSLVVLAGLLLFALVFLLVTRELPRWPVAMGAGAALFVGGFYWGFFKLFGGSSLGTRLARLAGYGLENEEELAARFR